MKEIKFHMYTKEMELLRALFRPVSEEVWRDREDEARAIMTRWLGEHPDDIKNAVATVSELREEIREQMKDLRHEHLYGMRSDPDKVEIGEDDYCYAHRFLRLSAINYLLQAFERDEGDCYIHLCNKGCEAVQAREAEEKKE